MGMIMHDDVPYGSGTSYTQGTGIAINNNVIAVDADNTPTAGSEKPVKSKGVHLALEANREESASLLKSTVGWTGKNLLLNNATSQTTHGITYTVNADGTITSNGASDGWANLILCNNLPLKKGKYILSGIPNVNGAYLTIAKQSGDISCTFSNSVRYFELASDEVLTEVRISYRANITVSDAIFYPMLRDASIADDTYEPYHESVEEEIEQIYADNGVLGAKNLLVYPYYFTTRTINGVTFTDNADGSITVGSSEESQTASAKIEFYFASHTKPYTDMSRYSGKSLTLNGGTSDVTLNFWNATSGNFRDSGSGVTFSVPSLSGISWNICVVIQKDVVIATPVTIYPMLRLASDPDDTYVPYAMTNRELTEKVSVKPLTINLTASDKAIKMRDDSRRCGNVVNIRIQLQVTSEIANGTEIFRLDGLPHPGYAIAILGDTNEGTIIPLVIVTSNSNFVASCRKAIPIGFYAISYTYIE